MNEQSGLDGQNILGNEDILNRVLADAAVVENAVFEPSQNDGAYTDPLNGSAIELTRIESSSSDPGLELFKGDVETAFGVKAASASAISSDNYAVFAEGKLVIKGLSDFDGDPINPKDDAKIYAADGFDIKSNSTFPVLRDDAGEPILDPDGKQQLNDGAVVVADGYSKAEAKATQNNLSGLIPPQVVEATTLEIPAYSDLVTDELAKRISPGTEPIIFNTKQNKIKNATDWNNLFPPGGTVKNPTYVRVTGGQLDIPNNVDLSNYTIKVEFGDIKFKGSNNSLDNVLLQAEDGQLEAKKLVANNVSILASDKIDIKSESRFTGENLIANGKGKIEFFSSVTTPNENDSLRVISADDVELKSSSNLRGQLLSRDDLNVKGQSTFYGQLGAKGDITFDGGVEVYATSDELEATIDSVTVTETDAGTVARLNVSLSDESSSIVSVDYATNDGTAVAGSDYQTTTGTLAFGSGETSSTIEVPVVGDNVYEADEAFTVNLTNPDGVTLNNDTATVEIVNDDELPGITVASVEVIEANATAEFTVTLTNPSSFPVTVDYATVDGSALAGVDYQASFGTLTFEPGETTKNIAVELIDDSIYELTEAFTLDLSNPSSAAIASASAEATIVENDEPPALSINSVVVTEGEDTAANFEVTLSQPAAVPVTVEYFLTDSTATGVGGTRARGTITLAPGEISQTIVSIPVTEDSIDELDEIYTVELSNPVNATIVTGRGTATIEDNDPPPVLSVADSVISEGDDGTTEAVFTVSLDNPSGKEITVGYFTADGTATAGSDYEAASGTLTFAPGETTKTVTVAVTGDNLDEDNETLSLNLDNATNAVISELQGILTITDDDEPPLATVDGVRVVEDSEESTSAVFTVLLDAPSGKEITLDYATVNGSAVAGEDYIATSGTLTFAPGEISQTIAVPVLADSLDEIDEAFGLELTNPTNVTTTATEITATIADNDEPPTVAIDSVTLIEGDEGTSNATFTVSLDNPSGKEIAIDYATVDGTAIAGKDYTAQAGTITFEPGETSKTAEIAIKGDTLSEIDENLAIVLTNPRNVILADNEIEGTATIIDNDELLALAGTTPLDGATEVGSTFRPQIFFNKPIDISTLTSDNFYASFSGEKLDATIVPSEDGTFAWLFFDGPMPDSSLIEVTVDGSTIKTLDGEVLDANNDGTPGGINTISFTTVSLEPVANTTITGMVVDPGTDLEPFTDDDFNPGADGIKGTEDDEYLLPIAGAEVFILGLKDQKVITDEQGRFTLDSVPAGNVKVAIEGMTATNAPEGYYFPEMVMDVNTDPGLENLVMGMEHIYLPRLDTEILNTVSANETTKIAASEVSAPELDPEQRDSLSLEIQPESLVGKNGQKLNSAEIGISTVPPELVRDMLPPGVLQHTFDITIQAPGVTRFSTPAPITFPNVFDAEPGTKLNFLSFNHETGRLEIEGTATVSDDGKTVSSDPGTGITQPGWHGVTPPGGCGGSGGPPPTQPVQPVAPEPTETVNNQPLEVLNFITKDSDENGFETLTWSAPPENPNTPPLPPIPGCEVPRHRPNDNNQQPFINVTIEVEGPLKEFMDAVPGSLPLESGAFTLSPGSQDKEFGFNTKKFLNDDGTVKSEYLGLNANQLYGSKIKITEIKQEANGDRTRTISEYELYRFLDLTDANHNGETIEFEDTLIDGTRDKQIQLQTGSLQPSLNVEGTAFSISGSTLSFNPTSSEVDQLGKLKILPSAGTIPSTDSVENWTISLKGDGEPIQTWYVDKNPFKNTIIEAFDNEMNDIEKAIFSENSDNLALSETKVSNFIDDTIAEAEEILNLVGGSERVDSPSPITVVFNDFDSDGDSIAPNSTTAGKASIVDRKENDLCHIITVDVRTPRGLPIPGVNCNSSLKRNSYSISEQNFRLSESLNETRGGKNVDIYVDRYFVNRPQISDWSRERLVRSIGKTIAHEFGHSVGLVHTNNLDSRSITEIMTQGLVLGDQLNWNITQEAFKVALGLPWDENDGQTAVNYYDRYYTAGRVDDFRIENNIGSNLSLLQINDGFLWLSEPETENYTTTIDFGKVDPSGESKTLNYNLTNFGDEPAIIKQVSLVGDTNQFSLEKPSENLELQPGETREIAISFDPTTTGETTARLEIKSDALQPLVTVPIVGFGQTVEANASVEAPNNNLGGVALDKETSEATDFTTITNNGAKTLTISDIKLVEGNDTFTLSNIPTDLDTNPLELEFGESFTFGDLTFDPNQVGLDRAVVEVTTNDPENPVLRIDAVGTGLDEVIYPEWGNDYIAIETPNLPNAPVLRTISDDEGNFDLFLPPEEDYHMTVFDPTTGLVSHSYGTTAPSGQGIDLTASIVFDASTEIDTDFDGLADDIELALGTAKNKIDTDGDGLGDLVELEQGLDPLGGRTLPTGIIGALSLPGQAKEIVIEGSVLNAGEQLAYVATGSHGMAIVDASNLTNLIQLGEIDLAGDATDIAVDSELGIAAVATNSGGLQLVDISDSAMPNLIQTLDFNANQVEIYDGVAFVSVGSSLKAVDLLTGEELSSISQSNNITGIAREGDKLYTMNSARVLQVVDISGDTIANQDFLTLQRGGGKLFVGNGVAYVTANNDFRGGYSTVDVSNANAISLISNPDTDNTNNGLPSQAIATNGSGLGLIIGTLVGFGNNANNLSVVDTSNPENTFAFLNQVNLPASPQSLAIASGIAYVADGNGGLQVINYLNFDNQAQAPTISIRNNLKDLDRNVDGIQVIEGSSIPIQVDIEEDVQVRNVELLVDGELVTNDVSFPFDLNAIAPRITPESDTVEIQVRATDTGGNARLSNPLTLQLIPDPIPPEIDSIKPNFGSVLGEGLRTVKIKFSESLAIDTVNTNSIKLLNGEGNVIVPENIQLRNEDRLVQLTLPPLSEGDYELIIDSSKITDRVGNVLGTENVVSTFTLEPTNIELRTNITDLDLNKPKIQVNEETFIELQADVSSAADITFRNIEFLVNGEVVSKDSTNPFTFSFDAPEITTKSDDLYIQARSTDSNGSVVYSEPIDIEVVDYIPPTISSFEPDGNNSVTSGRQTVKVAFSESITPETLNEETVRLFDENNNLIVPQKIERLDDGKTVELILEPLETGNYQLQLKAAQIKDLSGNSLGTEDLVHSFTLEPIELAVSSNDFDPEVEGIQIPENSTTVPINVDISNPGDTQVKKLELFVNGELIESDDTAPFKLSPLDLSLLELDSDSITVEASVVDSNGTTFLSKPQIFSLVPDTFGPTISFTNVDRYGYYGMRNIQITFNEPLSVDSADIGNFQLFRRGNLVEPLGIELNDNGQLVKLNYNGLYPGNHELIINSPAITDELGNVMGTEPFAKSFTVYFVD